MSRPGTIGRFSPYSWMLLTVAIVVVTVVMRAGGYQGQQYDYSYPGKIYPKTIVIAWDDSVARLDTSSGAIYRFRGDLRNPNVRDWWEIVAEGVGTRTSGRLEIQKAQGPNISTDATFLVDQITGDTWILRRRAEPRATWDPVPIKR